MLKHLSIPQAQRYTYIITIILLFSKVILLYFYYNKKDLIYITIAALSSH